MASIPVVAVSCGGNPMVNAESKIAYEGTNTGSPIPYFSLVLGLETTTATVASEPVPAVVGTMIINGGFFLTFNKPLS